ncbi:hypothetical protein BT63DRAFT_192442 [Microthyrium microscopicum]|uniref:Uncharacterized protein n=1 Tax=Microthyrium microscopicum TaxID=703497 RepID=A0A6A6UMF3_9PEZI|nr:hypothetical protein BT63DRAFT_192442 [Microthyrium microscopicum]
MKSFAAILLVLGAAASPAATQDSTCQKWCDNTNFPAQCSSQAKSNLGPCYTCGPYKTNTAAKLCDGLCADTSNDSKNCDSCENLCDANKTCSNGKCVKSAASQFSSSTPASTSSISLTATVTSSARVSASSTASTTVKPSSSKTSSSTSSSKTSSSTSSSKTSSSTSSSKTSSSTSSSSISCALPTIPARTYALDVTLGSGNQQLLFPGAYRYELRINTIPAPSTANAALTQCKALCSSQANCRTIAVYKYNDGSYLCETWASAYSDGAMISPGSGDTTTGLIPTKLDIYSVTNWAAPAGPILQNGQFANGCLEPWGTGAAPDIDYNFNDTATFFEVLPCGSDCPTSSSHYLHFTYVNNLPGVPLANMGLSAATSPSITSGTTYTLSFWVKGNSGGSINVQDITNPNNTFDNTYAATGAWQHVTFNIVAEYNLQLFFQVHGTSLIDWYLADVSLLAVA